MTIHLLTPPLPEGTTVYSLEIRHTPDPYDDVPAYWTLLTAFSLDPHALARKAREFLKAQFPEVRRFVGIEDYEDVFGPIEGLVYEPGPPSGAGWMLAGAQSSPQADTDDVQIWIRPEKIVPLELVR